MGCTPSSQPHSVKHFLNRDHRDYYSSNTDDRDLVGSSRKKSGICSKSGSFISDPLSSSIKHPLLPNIGSSRATNHRTLNNSDGNSRNVLVVVSSAPKTTSADEVKITDHKGQSLKFKGSFKGNNNDDDESNEEIHQDSSHNDRINLWCLNGSLWFGDGVQKPNRNTYRNFTFCQSCVRFIQARSNPAVIVHDNINQKGFGKQGKTSIKRLSLRVEEPVNELGLPISTYHHNQNTCDNSTSTTTYQSTCHRYQAHLQPCSFHHHRHRVDCSRKTDTIESKPPLPPPPPPRIRKPRKRSILAHRISSKQENIETKNKSLIVGEYRHHHTSFDKKNRHDVIESNDSSVYRKNHRFVSFNDFSDRLSPKHRTTETSTKTTKSNEKHYHCCSDKCRRRRCRFSGGRPRRGLIFSPNNANNNISIDAIDNENNSNQTVAATTTKSDFPPQDRDHCGGCGGLRRCSSLLSISNDDDNRCCSISNHHHHNNVCKNFQSSDRATTLDDKDRNKFDDNVDSTDQDGSDNEDSTLKHLRQNRFSYAIDQPIPKSLINLQTNRQEINENSSAQDADKNFYETEGKKLLKTGRKDFSLRFVPDNTIIKKKIDQKNGNNIDIDDDGTTIIVSDPILETRSDDNNIDCCSANDVLKKKNKSCIVPSSSRFSSSSFSLSSISDDPSTSGAHYCGGFCCNNLSLTAATTTKPTLTIKSRVDNKPNNNKPSIIIRHHGDKAFNFKNKNPQNELKFSHNSNNQHHYNYNCNYYQTLSKKPKQHKLFSKKKSLCRLSANNSKNNFDNDHQKKQHSKNNQNAKQSTDDFSHSINLVLGSRASDIWNVPGHHLQSSSLNSFPDCLTCYCCEFHHYPHCRPNSYGQKCHRHFSGHRYRHGHHRRRQIGHHHQLQKSRFFLQTYLKPFSYQQPQHNHHHHNRLSSDYPHFSEYPHQINRYGYFCDLTGPKFVSYLSLPPPPPPPPPASPLLSLEKNSTTYQCLEDFSSINDRSINNLQQPEQQHSKMTSTNASPSLQKQHQTPPESKRRLLFEISTSTGPEPQHHNKMSPKIDWKTSPSQLTMMGSGFHLNESINETMLDQCYIKFNKMIIEWKKPKLLLVSPNINDDRDDANNELAQLRDSSSIKSTMNVLRLAAQRADFSITTADSAESAMNAYVELQPDLMIIDARQSSFSSSSKQGQTSQKTTKSFIKTHSSSSSSSLSSPSSASKLDTLTEHKLFEQPSHQNHRHHHSGHHYHHLHQSKPFDAIELCRSIRNVKGSEFTCMLALVTSKQFNSQDEATNDDHHGDGHEEHNRFAKTTIVSLLETGFNRCLPETDCLGAMLNELIQLREFEIGQQRRLRAASMLFTALDSCKDGVVITGPNHDIQFANNSIEKIFGFRFEDMLGQKTQEFFQNDLNKADVDERIKNYNEGKEWEGQIYHRRKSGESVPIWNRILPINYHKGIPEFIIYIKEFPFLFIEKLMSPDLVEFPHSNTNSSNGSGIVHGSFKGASRKISIDAKTETRRPSLAKFNSVSLIEAPITRVINFLIAIKDNGPSFLAPSLDKAIETLKNSEVFMPPFQNNFKPDDRLTSELVSSLINTNKSGLRRMSHETASQKSSNLMAPLTPTSVNSFQSPPSLASVPSAIQLLLDDDLKWEFNVLELERVTLKQPLVWLGLSILNRFNVCQTLNCNENIMRNWLTMIESNYHENPYHNSTHAADVLQATAFFLMSPRLSQMLDPLDRAICLLAAIIHDIDHPGRNSAFLCNSNNELALMYNDISVLESHHAALGFRLTVTGYNSDSVNIFKNLDRETYRDMRASMIDMVLATEMTKHFEHLAKFVHVFQDLNNILDKNNNSKQEDINSTTITSLDDLKQIKTVDSLSCDQLPTPLPNVLMTEENIVLVKRMLIKCADVSNPGRPLELCKIWAHRIATEYCDQTEEEKKSGLPVVMPTFDKKHCSIPKSQIGFVDYFATDMFDAWNAFGDFPAIIENMNKNYQYWQDQQNLLEIQQLQQQQQQQEKSASALVSPPIRSSSSPSFEVFENLKKIPENDENRESILSISSRT